MMRIGDPLQENPVEFLVLRLLVLGTCPDVRAVYGSWHLIADLVGYGLGR